MCDKCQDLDKKVERYRLIVARVIDPQLAEGLGRLIEEAEAQNWRFTPSKRSKAVAVGRQTSGFQAAAEGQVHSD
jgi:hypothetical protein